MSACPQTAARGGLLCLTLMLAVLTTRADPVQLQRLRTEAAQAWREQLKDKIAIQGVCRQTLKDEKGERQGVVDVMFNTECARSQLTQSTGVTDVFCYNPKYTFHIRSTPDQGWVVVAFHAGDPATSPDALEVRGRLEQQAYVFEAGTRDPLYNEPLLQYFEDPMARVEAKVGPTGRPDLVEMKLDMGPPRKDSYVRKLNCLLDPASGWRPVRTELARGTDAITAEVTAEYEYAPGPNGLLQRAKIRSLYKNPDGTTREVRSDRRYELKRVTSYPDTSEFTLSAFGLPEPVGVEWPKRHSAWLWLAWAGAGFVMVALVFIALKRRAVRRQAAALPTTS